MLGSAYSHMRSRLRYANVGQELGDVQIVPILWALSEGLGSGRKRKGLGNTVCTRTVEEMTSPQVDSATCGSGT